MKKHIRGLFKGFMATLLCISVLSCKKTFDIAPGNALEPGQAYRNVYDADAAVMGVYGKLLRLAKQYVVLNELRGDLMDVTPNADKYLKQINTHTETVDNPYADPRPFYNLIIDCNDVLHNFDIMLQDKRMTQDEYNQRYSDIGAMRCWLYLQVGIHWGTVPYVTDPIANINDLQDESKFQRIPFDQLLDKLLAFAEALPYKDMYPAGASLLNTNDGYSMAKVFIVKKLVLGDLNLWKGNWEQAAGYYKNIMDYGQTPGVFDNPSEQYSEYYKIAWHLNGSDWADIFKGAYNERYQNYENIWSIPLDKDFQPQNPFIDMFSTSGSYLFKPSAKAIKNWNDETSISNAIVGDAYRSEGSYTTIGGQDEITKYLDEYNPVNIFETTGRWVLYRTAKVYLRYAEAANRDGRNRLAYALLNGKDALTNFFGAPDAGADVTYIQQTDTDPTSAYYFDARKGDFPSYRGPFYRYQGIRYRVSLVDFPIDSTKYFDTSKPERVITRDTTGRITQIEFNQPTDEEGFATYLEDQIIKEDAEELAFEANRWPDLLRVALRRESSDPNYLANKIAAKFEASGNSAAAAEVRAKLSNKANWYLPFKWQ